MKSRFALYCGLLSLSALGSCQYPPEPGAVLAKAIEAHGGEENITRPRIGVLKGKTVNGSLEVSQEELFELPKHWKGITTGTVQGKKKTVFTLVVEGKAWEWQEGDEPRETSADQGNSFVGILTWLIDLKRKDAKISVIKGMNINAEPAIGITAVWDGRSANFYFEKKKGLCVQAEFKLQLPSNKEYGVKIILGDYRDFDGVKLPFRRTIYAQANASEPYVLLADFVLTDATILDSLPKHTFALPIKE